MADKIDSNVTGAFYAEETSPKVVANDAPWYELEPNSYSDFGGDIKMVAREPINASRQRQKGSAVDLDASGGLTQDYTMNNHRRLLRGFFFADYTSKFGTAELGATPHAPGAVLAAGDTFAFAASPAFEAGAILWASGYRFAANNGLHVVKEDIDAGDPVAVLSPLADEPAPPAAAYVVHVGHEFPAGDVTIDAYPGGFTLTSATLNWADVLALRPGAWVFVGGDGAGNSYAQKGYARVLELNGKVATFDKATTLFADNAGAGIALRVFAGRFIRNEDDPDLIKSFSYQIGRSLGKDADGTQSQYLEGAYANTLKLNIPTADKMTVDIAYMALDDKQRDGVQGLKPGPHVKALGEEAINTSSDVYRLRMHIVDSESLNPTPLFGYMTEGNITIGNNVTAAKAVGVFGGFAVTVGNFEVGGQVTAYFSTVAAVQAIRNSADVSLDFILAKKNQGAIFDIPLLGLGGGRLNVAKDQPITIPLDIAAAESPFGFTLSGTFFPYLPDAAMPVR